MKTILLMASLTANPTQSEPEPHPCVLWGQFAHEAMTARQAGVDPYELAAAVAGNGIALSIIAAAFDTPIFGDAQSREIVADVFGDAIEAQCFKEFV